MNFDEIRKLGKKELAELVELLAKQNDELIAEKEALEAGLTKLKEEQELLAADHTALAGQLDEMQRSDQAGKNGEVSWEEAGNLAEYAVQVSQLLETTQRTADLYLANIKQKHDQIVEEARGKEERIEKASAAILKSLQLEVDRLLGDFKDNYEQLHGHNKGE